MVIPSEILAAIARDIDDFYGGPEWNQALTDLTDEEFRQWQLLMVAQIIARGVLTLDCEIRTPQLAPPPGKLRQLCRRLLRRA